MESPSSIQEHLPVTSFDRINLYTSPLRHGTHASDTDPDHNEGSEPFPPAHRSSLRVYLCVEDTTVAFWSTPSKSQEPTVGNVEMAPGLGFIAAVERRCGVHNAGNSLTAQEDSDRLKGRINEELVADFIDSHPYFSLGSLKPVERELYREKLAFYFIRKAGCRGMIAAADIVASATRLVAECIVRRSSRHAFAVVNNAEVFFYVPGKCDAALDILDHVRQSFAKARAHTVVFL